MKFFRLIAFLFFALSFSNCNQGEECREETDVHMTIGFMTRTFDEKTQTYKNSTLSIDSLWIRGLEKDSFLYKNKKAVKTVALPLRISSDRTGFEFRFNEITDTIYFFHSNNEQYFISLECGCVVAHEVLEVISTGHFSDSIIIQNKDVNTYEATHIQIFN